MGRLLVRLLIALLTFTIGTIVYSLSRGSGLSRCVVDLPQEELTTHEQGTNQADHEIFTRHMWQGCPSVDWLTSSDSRFVVVSIPKDREFYVGKRKAALAEISDRVDTQLGMDLTKLRVVFIKSGSTVRYKSLSDVLQKLEDTTANCVEIVPPKDRNVE